MTNDSNGKAINANAYLCDDSIVRMIAVYRVSCASYVTFALFPDKNLAEARLTGHAMSQARICKEN